MEIKISKESLAKKKLFVGMPCYGGMMTGMTAKSLLDLQSVMGAHGVETKFSFLFNESLIMRARNYIVDEFLNRSDCTHFLFIDADIAFNAQDLIAMLAVAEDEDKDIITIPYPKKSLEWGQLAKALKKNPNVPIEDWSRILGAIVFNPVAGTQKFSVTEPLQIMDGGTGLMLIKRSVFERFQEKYPEQMYRPDHVGQVNFGGEREICAFFDCEIDSESKRYLSEDYFFTQKCRKMGITTWMLPWTSANVYHIGTHMFQGDLIKIAAHVGEI